MPLSAASSLPARVGGYLLERFPPAAYAVLVTVFTASALRVAGHLGAQAPAPAAWLAAPVLFLVFLHLRVFDEHRDAARDLLAYPERLLSRGVVTLDLLRRMAFGAIALEAVLALAMGGRAFFGWLLVLAFTVAMRFEFGVGRRLEGHIVTYALVHNPVIALMGLFVWAASGVPWSPAFVAWIVAVSAAALAFEIGRKIRLPEEEIPGSETYSLALGRRDAGRLLRGVLLVSVAAGLFSVHLIDCTVDCDPLRKGAGAALVAASGLWAALRSRSGCPSKAVEGGATLHLAGALAGLGVAA